MTAAPARVDFIEVVDHGFAIEVAWIICDRRRPLQ
jgi:hypothetical protein